MYQSFKDKYPDSVLFFQIGENFTAFAEDAEFVSGAFDLPMKYGAVPIVGLDECLFKVHLNKLLRAGYKVTTYEQLGTRDIIKTYQPGKAKAG